MTNKYQKVSEFARKCDEIRNNSTLKLKDIASKLNIEYDTLKNYKYGKGRIPDKVMESLSVLYLEKVDQIDSSIEDQHIINENKITSDTIEILKGQIDYYQKLVERLLFDKEENKKRDEPTV